MRKVFRLETLGLWGSSFVTATDGSYERKSGTGRWATNASFEDIVQEGREFSGAIVRFRFLHFLGNGVKNFLGE